MTGLQTLTATPAPLLDLDPYRFPAVFLDDRHEETTTVRGTMMFGDSFLSAPTPSACPSPRLEPADRRRLELHAALTTAGIAPLPGDLDAIEALCALDDTTHTALRRWLSRFDTL
ncbi:hypothetical protein [Streptomyces sp. NPDC007355]|uniref:hypothetical protein n=1 Tax=Streptomyces sp. NPDC007355 TaxID=3364778 RepID=UPI0036B577D8